MKGKLNIKRKLLAVCLSVICVLTTCIPALAEDYMIDADPEITYDGDWAVSDEFAFEGDTSNYYENEAVEDSWASDGDMWTYSETDEFQNYADPTPEVEEDPTAYDASLSDIWNWDETSELETDAVDFGYDFILDEQTEEESDIAADHVMDATIDLYESASYLDDYKCVHIAAHADSENDTEIRVFFWNMETDDSIEPCYDVVIANCDESALYLPVVYSDESTDSFMATLVNDDYNVCLDMMLPSGSSMDAEIYVKNADSGYGESQMFLEAVCMCDGQKISADDLTLEFDSGIVNYSIVSTEEDSDDYDSEDDELFDIQTYAEEPSTEGQDESDDEFTALAGGTVTPITTITVYKDWNDADNQDGIRPDSITISLYENGEVVDTLILDDSNKWSGKFTDLDGDSSYSVREDDVPEGYQSLRQSAVDSMSGIESWGFTNEHTPETIDISGSAKWNDDNDQENSRPSSITIQLLADNVLVDEKAVNADDNWEWTFEDLPKYSEGSLITYTVLQKSVSGYTTSSDGYNVTNSYNPEKTQVSVRIVWDDSKNMNEIRPDSLTVALLKNEVETGDTAELSDSNNWSCTFDDLDEYSDGVLNTYSVAAVNIDGYDSVLSGDIESGFVLTNSILPETTSITATLIWDDGSDQDGKRPADVMLQLYADDVEYGDPVTVTGDGVSWTYTWTDLPELSDDTEITYTVKAASDIEDYDISYSTDGLTVTYTYTPSTVIISGGKTWNDADDQEGARPSSIVIRLYADGTEVSEKTVTADDDWKWSFDSLPKFSNGSEITYTIKEDAVDGYMSVIDGFNVTNTYESEDAGDVSDNDDGDTDGTETTEAPETETEAEPESETGTDADDDDGFAPTFYSVNAQVLSNDSNGSALDDYNRIELEMSTYLPTISADDLVNGNYTIRFHNKLSSGLNLDESDSDLSVYVGGQEISSAYYEIKDKVNSESEESSFHVDVDLTQLYIDGVIDDDDLDGSTEISVYYYAVPDTDAAESSYESTVWYEIRDNDVIHYTSNEDVVTIIIDIQSEISVSVLKVWDENGYDEFRPDHITVNLLADGNIVDSLSLNDGNYWLGEFSDLDRYQDGEQIAYTVEEEPVDGYESSVTGDIDTGFVITNTLTAEIEQELIDIDGKKIWDDDDNIEGIRPSEIEIILYADGIEIDETTVTEGDDWYWTFEGLPKYEDEASYDYREIEYTIDEKPVYGYESTIIGDADSGFTVINMLIDGSYSDLIDIEGWKVWDDDDNIEGIRPTEIKISLFADGNEIEETTVTENDDWHWVFEDLPKYQAYQDGEDQYYAEIVYTIDEMSVDGYYTTITGNSDYGFTVINSLIDYEAGSDYLNITAKKVWNDDDNQAGIRPTEIKISLYADGVEIDQAAVTAEENWTCVFENMPKYSEYIDGESLEYEEIKYTLKEMSVDGYESTITGNAEDGFVITNTRIVDESARVSVVGKKTWDDNDNLYGLRPSEIIIRLYADNEEIEWMTVKEENNWVWDFTDLPKYNGEHEIVYRISEDAVNGYTVTYNGYNATNTITEESKAAYIAEYGNIDGTTGSAAYENAGGSTGEGTNLDELLKGDGYLVQTGDDFNAVPLVAAVAVIVILCGCGIYFFRKRGKTAE